METTRRRIEQELNAVIEGGRRLAAGHEERALAWRPGPKRWSIAECLDHLGASAEVYGAAIDRRLEGLPAAEAPPPEGPLRLGRFESWFIATLEPPPRLRVPAPRRIRPVPRVDPAAALDHFERAHQAVLGRWQAALVAGLTSLSVPSPFVPLLRFGGPGVFAMLAAHGRRHLWQAERVVASPGFPG